MTMLATLSELDLLLLQHLQAKDDSSYFKTLCENLINSPNSSVSQNLFSRVTTMLYYALVVNQKQVFSEFYHFCNRILKRKGKSSVHETAEVSLNSWVNRNVIVLCHYRKEFLSKNISTFPFEIFHAISTFVFEFLLFLNRINTSESFLPLPKYNIFYSMQHLQNINIGCMNGSPISRWSQRQKRSCNKYVASLSNVDRDDAVLKENINPAILFFDLKEDIKCWSERYHAKLSVQDRLSEEDQTRKVCHSVKSCSSLERDANVQFESSHSFALTENYLNSHNEIFAHHNSQTLQKYKKRFRKIPFNKKISRNERFSQFRHIQSDEIGNSSTIALTEVNLKAHNDHSGLKHNNDSHFESKRRKDLKISADNEDCVMKTKVIHFLNTVNLCSSVSSLSSILTSFESDCNISSTGNYFNCAEKNVIEINNAKIDEASKLPLISCEKVADNNIPNPQLNDSVHSKIKLEVTLKSVITGNESKIPVASNDTNISQDLVEDSFDVSRKICISPTDEHLQDRSKFFMCDILDSDTSDSIVFDPSTSSPSKMLFLEDDWSSDDIEIRMVSTPELVFDSFSQDHINFNVSNEENTCPDIDIYVTTCSPALQAVNSRWNELMLDVEDSPRTPTKITFAVDEQLVKIHKFEAIEPEYDDSIETYILDQIRFKCRIQDLSNVLSPFLTQEHRSKVYEKNLVYVDESF